MKSHTKQSQPMLTWIKNEFKQGGMLMSYSGIKLTGLGATFLVPIILATRFSPKIFGVYSLAMMIVYFFNASLILSSGKPTIIFGGEEMRENQQISATTTSRMILLLLSLTLFLAFLFFFSQQIMTFTGLTAGQVKLLVLVFIGKTVESFFSSLFLTFNKRILESAYFLVNGVLSVIYILILYFFFEMTLAKVFFMFFITPVLSIFLFMSKIEFKKILPLSYNKVNLLKMTNFTKWMIFGGAGVYLLNWGDNIILRKFVGMEEIGVYNLGYQFFKGTMMSITVIKVYFLPFIAQQIGNPEKIKNYLKVKRIKLVLIGLFLLFGMYLVMPYFVEFLYKPQYQGATLVFRILVIAAGCSLYSGFYDPILESLRRYKFIQGVTVAGVAVNLSLDYILVGRIGYTGAAIATTITYIGMALAREIYFRKYCRKEIFI